MRDLKSPFTFCPNCKSERHSFSQGKEFFCLDCNFRFFQNTAAAVGAVILQHGKILFLVRAKEPSKGSLDVPGGFVDVGESAEEALIRECKEELGIEIQRPQYFASFSNRYSFGGIDYSTCDMFYHTTLPIEQSIQLNDEALEYRLIPMGMIPWEEIGFPSVREAVERLSSEYFG